jgi:flagellar protein FliJ
VKRFRFRLEPVLTLRNWEEERAKTAYGQALQQEHRIAGELRAVEVRIEAGVAEWRAQTSRPAHPSERTMRWRHLLTLERERADVAGKLLSARRIREQKMKLLVECHRRVKVLDTLKDRQNQAHLADQRRREEREVDDIVNARFQPDL